MRLLKGFVLRLRLEYYGRASHKHLRLAEKYKNVDNDRWGRHAIKALDYMDKELKIHPQLISMLKKEMES